MRNGGRWSGFPLASGDRAQPEARRRGALTESERTDWAGYARLVRPLLGRAAPPHRAIVDPPPAALPVAMPPAARLPARRDPPLLVGAPPPGLDRASWGRLRGGKLAAERTLDLHGQTAERAFHALVRFLHAAHGDQVRCVEIITGRGRDGVGVIRRELPLWLNQPPLRALVLAAAHPHAANPGSTRLLLRRVR